MLNIFKKHPVSDPAFYDSIIKKQKKCARKQPSNAGLWLELGRLHEAKVEFIESMAKRQFWLRFFIPIYLLGISFLIFFGFIIFSSQVIFLSLRYFTFTAFGMVLVSVLFGWMWSLRYPRSGWKYFKKVIRLDPTSAEAYMHLGLISLRWYRKRPAYLYLEKTIELGISNNSLERQLKRLYHKEFISLFNKKTERESQLQSIIDDQFTQIKALRAKVSSLSNLIESLTIKADQAKWETKHKTKQLTKEMDKRLLAIEKEYEKEMAEINQTPEDIEDPKEALQKDLVRLTTEIMEAKAELEESSLASAESSVEAEMESHIWQTLMPQTRRYLATAEHIFNILADEEGTPDYSLIGMELCKALEVEINNTLVSPFAKYLNGNEKEFLKTNQIGQNKGKPRYYTYLAQVVDQHNYPETTSLTLGQFHFILKNALRGDYALKAYGSFLEQIYSLSRVRIEKRFLKNLETVTTRYRNTIAHEAPMNKKECDHLRKLIFAGDDALLKTCARVKIEPE